MFATRIRLGTIGGFALITIALSIPMEREAHACSCLLPPGYVLPMSGSRLVPRNTRIFIYLDLDVTRYWFNPSGEGLFSDPVRNTDIPGALRLVGEDGTEIPLQVERSDIRQQGPSAWWLLPASVLAPNARYQVRLASKDKPVVLSEFMTTTETDEVPDHTGSPVSTVELRYWPGRQRNDLGDCGGINALWVRFYDSWVHPTYESPFNRVVRLFLRRYDGTYDLASLTIDFPYVAAAGGWGGASSGYSIGWIGFCSVGLRLELEECTEWCVRAGLLDLAGNIRHFPEEHCVVLSSLIPWTPEGDGERMRCPGEIDTEGERDAGDSVAANGDSASGGRNGTCALAHPSASRTPIGLLLACLFAAMVLRPGRRRSGFKPKKVFRFER